MKIYLDFNFDGGAGSPEHFYHFFIGYLLPALLVIDNIESLNKKKKKKEFIFRKCGPLMDEITNTVSRSFGLNFSIIDYEDIHMPNIIKVPRLEIRIGYNIGDKKKDRIQLPYFVSYNYPRRTLNTIEAIKKIRKIFLKKINSEISLESFKEYKDSILLLKRSPVHGFYKENGEAKIKNYGTGRRSIKDIEIAESELKSKGFPVKIFEPGKYNIYEQIVIFNKCKGAIGIMGAEFANIIWMREGTLLIRLVPEEIRHYAPITINLANVLNIKLHDIHDISSMHPKLDIDIIEKLLS